MLNHPAVGTVVTVVLGYLVYTGWNSSRSAYTGSVIRRGAAVADATSIAAGLREMRTADPGFDRDRFAERVRAGFTKLQSAWCEQNLQSVRPFISDGIHERFSLQFAEQRALGYRPHMEGLNILECRIAQVECTPVFDVVTMRIGASARDLRISAADGKPIPGSEEAESFVEYWSFIRTRGSQTLLNKAGLIEGHCPNCGAAIELNQGAKCQYCQALLRSGQYDWVLAEITQEEYWSPVTVPAPGTLTMRASDPGFSTQTVEDMASVIFWRKAAADRMGRIDPLRKVAAPEWCEQHAAELNTGPAQPRQFYCDCAVSAVDTVGVIPGQPEDRVLLRVAWMGRLFVTREEGTILSQGPMTIFQSLYVLARQAGVKSLPEQSLSSAHCPNCGGAESLDTSNACEFCGTVLNDGTRGWVLRAIWPAQSGESRSLIEQAVSVSQRDGGAFAAIHSPAGAGPGGALLWMIQSVVSFGGMANDSLREMLQAAGARQGVSAERVDELIRMAIAGQIEIPVPQNSKEACAWLLEMAVAAMITGGLSKGEADLLMHVGTSHGLVAHDVNQLIARSRKVAYDSAKVTLRAAKREKRLAAQDAAPPPAE